MREADKTNPSGPNRPTYTDTETLLAEVVQSARATLAEPDKWSLQRRWQMAVGAIEDAREQSRDRAEDSDPPPCKPGCECSMCPTPWQPKVGEWVVEQDCPTPFSVRAVRGKYTDAGAHGDVGDTIFDTCDLRPWVPKVGDRVECYHPGAGAWYEKTVAQRHEKYWRFLHGYSVPHEHFASRVRPAPPEPSTIGFYGGGPNGETRRLGESDEAYQARCDDGCRPSQTKTLPPGDNHPTLPPGVDHIDGAWSKVRDEDVVRVKPCPTCNGTGDVGQLAAWRCQDCKGSGVVG